MGAWAEGPVGAAATLHLARALRYHMAGLVAPKAPSRSSEGGFFFALQASIECTGVFSRP